MLNKKKTTLLSILFILICLLPVAILFTGFQTYNLAAYYSDQTRILDIHEIKDETILELAFLIKLNYICFWISLLLFPSSIIGYIILLKRK